MKRIGLTLLTTFCCIVMFAQSFNEWRDPELNQINREPMHASINCSTMDVARWRTTLTERAAPILVFTSRALPSNITNNLLAHRSREHVATCAIITSLTLRAQA